MTRIKEIMSDEKITYSVHNYDPVNKYIDEKSRIKNAKSVWAYTKSLYFISLNIRTILSFSSLCILHLYKIIDFTIL